MNYFAGLIGSFGASMFFGLMFHTPRHCLFTASAIGMVSYLVYMLVLDWAGSVVGAAFASSMVIASLSEVAARLHHSPASIFASIAIIPLVPGGGLYRTMFYMVHNDFAKAGVTGVETVLVAGCIALAIAIVTAFTKQARPPRKDND